MAGPELRILNSSSSLSLVKLLFVKKPLRVHEIIVSRFFSFIFLHDYYFALRKQSHKMYYQQFISICKIDGLLPKHLNIVISM